jgi:hypothetical protein
MTVRSWLKSHGFHTTQTTQSLNGGLFTRRTKTPTTPFQNQVKPDGVDKKQLERMRKQTAIKDSETAHVKFNGKNLKQHAAALLDKHEWENVLVNEEQHLFPGSNPRHLERFENQMSWVQQHLPAGLFETPDARKEPREARVLSGTTMTVLLNAASTACMGLNAEDAGNAIACLQHIDMLGAIRAPFGAAAAVPANGGNVEPKRSDGAAFNRQDMANAWRIAIELERSGEAGFNVLKHLMHKPAPPGHRMHPTVARQRDALLHTYLQAAREKVLEAGRRREVVRNNLQAADGSLMPDPLSIHSHVNIKIGGGAANNEPGGNPADGAHAAGPTIGGRVLPPPAGNVADPTLLDKALKAVSNHLDQVQTHAANANNAGRQITFDRHHGDIRPGTNPATYAVLQKDCNWWAANAVRNGIYSVDSKQYRKMQNRAEKMVTWLHRANNNGAAAGLSTGQKVQRWLGQAFAPFKNKSPFQAYNSVVPKSPHRLQGGTDASGISDGQTLRQNMIWNLEKAIEQHGVAANGGPGTPLRTAVYPANIFGTNPLQAHPKAGQACVPNDPAPRVLQQMVRLAILKSQYRFNDTLDGDKLFITRHNDGDKLEGLDLERAKEKVYAMFVNGFAGQNNMTQTMIDAYFTMENKQISPETLIEWANDVGDPAALHAAATLSPDLATRNRYVAQAIANYRTAPAAAPANWAQPDWNAFVDGVNRTLLGEVEAITNAGVDLTNLTDTAAAQLFEEVIKRQKLGHLIEMKEGAVRGIKTQGISYILSRLLFGGTQSVGIDLRYLHGKHADIQFGTGTGGRDLFMGTVKSQKTQAGAGYVYGPGHVSKKADGWSMGLAAGTNVTPYSGEWAEKVGNLFRFRRVFSGVDSDDIGNAQLGRLTRKLMDPNTNPGANEGGAWINPADPTDTDILKKILHEFDDVSVGWLNSKDRIFKESVSGGTTASLKVGPWGPGIGASIGAEFTQSKTTWREEGGSLNQERDIKATEAKVSVSGVLSLVATTLANLNLPADSPLRDLLDPSLLSGALKAGFQDGLMASADVGRTGTSRRHTWIYHDGALTYSPGICSFYQKTHKNAAAYVYNVLKKVDILARDKAKVFEQPKYYAGQPAADTAKAGAKERERRAAIDREITKLLEDLHAVVTNPKSTQEFREYYEWSPKYLQMINDLESVIRSEKAKPNWERNQAAKARVKDYERELAKLKSLDDETVRLHGEYRFNITDNVEFKTKNKGLNTLGVNQHDLTFRDQRIDEYT